MRVYLSPSGQIHNEYAYGNYTEAQVCRMIAGKCKSYLNKGGADVVVAEPYDNDAQWKARINESDNFEADYHVPIHTNAGGGHGVRVFTSKKNIDDERAIRCCANIKKILPDKFKKGGISVQNSLYEINAPKAKTIYIECAFHDNKAEAQWIVEHVDALGKAIAEALLLEEIKENKELYRVQVGAYSKRENAENMAKELESKGYKTIIKVDGVD